MASNDGKNSLLLRICNLLMASLFALSASFQFNDPDWYFWIPLYSSACIVNWVNGSKPESRMRNMGKFALWLGVFLFIKVGVEDWTNRGNGGFWWVDMRERGVREKFGSGLVVISMLLVLSGPNQNPAQAHLTKYGMAILVGVAYGLSFLFFTFQHHEMRF